MKSFIWRMRSNFGYFLTAMAIFTVIYVIIAYSNISIFGNIVRCLKGIDPTIVSGCVCFSFFLICTKRYTYDEAYLYGQSRKGAFCSALCSATVYAVLFAFYALGTALLVRRAILSAPYIALSTDLYDISATEIFCNFAYIFIVNMIAYEAANLLRKFRSWKFWIALIACTATFIMLYVFVFAMPQSKNIGSFNYWQAAFLTFLPQLAVMLCADFLMARGRISR